MDEATLTTLAAAQRDLLDRLIGINAELLRLEARRAGLELEIGARARPGDELERERAAAVADADALSRERDALTGELEAIVERMNRPLLS